MLKKKTIREILDQLFAGRGVGYELKGKNIMLSPIKEKPAAEPDRKMISGRVTDVSGHRCGRRHGDRQGNPERNDDRRRRLVLARPEKCRCGRCAANLIYRYETRRSRRSRAPQLNIRLE